MTISFVDGPFDGVALSPLEASWPFAPLSITTPDAVRTFVVFPARDDWPEVTAGRLRVRDSYEYHYYELIDSSDGPRFRYEPDARHYRRAICESL